MRQKNWSQSVIVFISPLRMNGLKTACSLPKRRDRGKKPCEMSCFLLLIVFGGDLSLSLELCHQGNHVSRVLQETRGRKEDLLRGPLR